MVNLQFLLLHACTFEKGQRICFISFSCTFVQSSVWTFFSLGLIDMPNTPHKPKTKKDYCKDEHRSSYCHPDTSPNSTVALMRTFCIVLFFSLLHVHQLQLQLQPGIVDRNVLRGSIRDRQSDFTWFHFLRCCNEQDKIYICQVVSKIPKYNCCLYK